MPRSRTAYKDGRPNPVQLPPPPDVLDPSADYHRNRAAYAAWIRFRNGGPLRRCPLCGSVFSAHRCATP
jgi:hypothetical protein